MSELRRYVPILIAGGALIAAACADTVSPAPEATSFTRLGDQSFSIVARPDDANARTETFVIARGGSAVRIGEFKLRFDADAVCALDSGYGEGFWQRDCTPIGRDIEITAKIFTDENRSYVEFSPDIRFNPDRDVVMSAVRTEIIGVHLTRKTKRDYDLWYTRRIANSRLLVDESWRDPDLRTHFNSETGRVWRKIRHFSGYVIHVGHCTDNPTDAACGGGNQY